MSREVPMKPVTAVAVVLLSASAVSGCQTMTGRTAGQHFNDKWVLHETKGRIAAQIPRALTAMNVDVNRGTVYLIGTVGTPEQKVRAEQIARRGRRRQRGEAPGDFVVAVGQPSNGRRQPIARPASKHSGAPR